MKVKLSQSLRYELFARLEEQGSTEVGDEFAPLTLKISRYHRNGEIDVNEAERKELLHHCNQMIAIADEDYYGEDKQFNKEARWAKKLKAQLV